MHNDKGGYTEMASGVMAGDALFVIHPARPQALTELKPLGATLCQKTCPSKRSYIMKILSFLVSLLFFWRKKKSVVPVVRLAGVISSAPSLRRGLSLNQSSHN